MPSYGEVERLEGGWRGTARTIDQMHKLVALGKLDPTMHKIATWLSRNVDHNDFEGYRQALWSFLRNCGKFQRDPAQIERIEHPLAAIEAVVSGRLRGLDDWSKKNALFVGDCDLFSIMGGTIAGLWGFNYGFETVKGDNSRPDEYSHVYPVILFPDKGFVPFDATVQESYIGWRPPLPAERRKIWAEPDIEQTGVLNMNMNGMGSGPTTYVPMDADDRLDYNPERPIRIDDIIDSAIDRVEDPGIDQARAIANKVLDKVVPEVDYPADFGDGGFYQIRPFGDDAILPQDFGIPQRLTPILPAASQADAELPPENQIRSNDFYYAPEDRPPVQSGYEMYPRYHDPAKTRVSRHEFLNPRFPFARSLDTQGKVYEPIDAPPPNLVPQGIPTEYGERTDMRDLSGYGMGDEPFVGPTMEQAAASNEAASSIWGDIASIAGGALKLATPVVQAKINADLQTKVLTAQKAVLDSQAAATKAQTAAKMAVAPTDTPFYKNPVVIGGGVLAVAALIYAAMKSR